MTTHTLRINGKKRSTLDDRVCVDCRKRAGWQQALSQSRSYSDEGPAPARNVRPKRRKRSTATTSSPSTTTDIQQQRRGIHSHTQTPLFRDGERNPNDFHDEPTPSPPYPAQDSWPSQRRSEHAGREGHNYTKITTEEEALELWENFQRDDGEGGNNVPKRNASADPPSRSKEEEEKMLEIDYKSHLSSALLKREADLVIRCLFSALHFNDRDFLRDLPATTFSEIIRVLEPRHFMSKLANAHHELSADMARQLGVAPMREVAYEYASVLKEVISMRRGIRMTLSDFKALLRSARDLGHQKLAHMLWNVLWAEGHTPDTKCYNLYMASAVWNGVHSAGSREKLRVIDFNMAARKKEKPRNRFAHYRVGAGGVRERSMAIFNEMLANGVVANEESFRIVITAAAREGDVGTMKSIFKKVWNVDVDAILAGEEDEAAILPKSVPTHSALYPTPELLFVIAHAFGINNDIPSALRIVDFVARHYRIPITRRVWDQLFEWTFVLAIDRHGTDKNSGSHIGQLPAESVMSLWNTMISEPYRVEPSMGMYDHLIKNLFQRGETCLLAEKMEEGRVLYWKHRRHAKNVWNSLRNHLRDPMGRAATTGGGGIEKLRHKYEAADLVRRRDILMLKRWLRLLLGSYRESHRRESGAMRFARDLPRILDRWKEFAPTVVKYETPSGFVEFRIRGEETIRAFARERFEERRGKKEELREGGAERYVGERWLGGEVRPARRVFAKREMLA